MGNNKYKILIVEDEANIRSFIKANLETSDYQVLCAETCAPKQPKPCWRSSKAWAR